MAVQLSRRTQQHIDRRTQADAEWWLPLALIGCLLAVVACAAAALAL